MLFKWLSDNQMKTKNDKCHFIISSNDASEIKIGNSMIKSSNFEKLLGVKIDTKLTYNDHTKGLRRKANSDLCALERFTPYMGLGKSKLLMNSFFAATFNYCPLIRMFYSRSDNNKITHLHERCYQLIYSDKSSSYEELLERDESGSIRHKNIQAIQLKLSSKILKDTSEIS